MSPLKAAYVAAALLDTALAASSSKQARRFTKPLLMPLLATAVPVDGATRTAQAFSWGGDVALLGSGTKPFLAGTASFAAAHASSIRGFARVADPTTTLGSRTSTRSLAAVWLLAAPVLAARAARKDPVLGVAVAAYAGLLVTMAAHALHLDPALPRDSRWLSGAGALLFLVSDTTLAVRTFALEDPDPRLGAVVMATYTAAQLLLAEGAARA